METYELLQPPDYQQFTEVFEKFTGRVPDLRTMTAVVAKDGDEIVGLLGLYTVTVVDTMWIKPEYRHKGIWKKIFEAGLRLPWGIGRGFHLIASRKREEVLAKKFGMSQVPFKLFKKVF